ncbi:MAG: hypothetical protein ABJA37_03110 [Ferruginibacter sp.]
MKNIQFFLIAFCVLLMTISCKKETFITSADARLTISADSIKFDTVFTSVGSITKSFKITNNNDQRLRLSSVKLMGGTSSPFKINVNGIAAGEADNIDIAANDSIYIFVSVTVNQTTTNLPFILSDSIAVNYNGNTRFVQLQAFGQNANFLTNAIITSDTTWNSNLPYVILGGLKVDNGATLTIPAGVKIYFHGNAAFIIDGTLIVNGTKLNSVLFAGDRLDEPYNNLPAGWPGIFFRAGSKDNQIKFAVIKNAYQAVVVQEPSVNANPKLIMHQTIIDNAFDAGLLCTNTSVQVDNCLISNCGSNILIQLGGNYTFTNCTAASFSNTYLLRKMPVLSAVNFLETNGSTSTADLNALFLNCIFWGDNGSIDNEVLINKQGSNLFNVSLDHCLYKALNDPAYTSLVTVIKNQDPYFDSIDVSHKYYDFRITKNAAPGINKGSPTSFLKDLDDTNRSNGLPDIGCYEKQ